MTSKGTGAAPAGSGVVTGGRLVIADQDSSTSTLGPAVDVHVDQGVITDITKPGARQAGKSEHVIDAAGLVLLPGMINGHTHTHELFYRGRYPKMPLEQWMHYVRPPTASRPSPHDVYVRTAVCAVEALRGGATCVVDDVGLPGLPAELLDAVLAAYRDVGVRAVVAPTMADRSFAESIPLLADHLSPQTLGTLRVAVGEPDAVLETLRQQLTCHSGHPHRRVRLGVAASAPQRCSDEFFIRLAQTAEAHDVPLLSHVNETRVQAVTAQLLYGKTMTAHLDALGVLSSRLSIIHGVWLTDDDAAALAANDTTVQHNPVSNLRLGSGVASVRRLKAAGVRVSLGTDGVGSTVAASMLATTREAALLSTARHRHFDGWVEAIEAFQMATVDGAAAIGAGDLGRIQQGYRADMVGYSLDHPQMTPLNDPMRQIIYGQPPVDLVVVDGRVTLRQGEPTLVDWRRIASEATRIHARLLDEIIATQAWIDQHLSPPLKATLKKLEQIPIPEDTYMAVLG